MPEPSRKRARVDDEDEPEQPQSTGVNRMPAGVYVIELTGFPPDAQTPQDETIENTLQRAGMSINDVISLIMNNMTPMVSTQRPIDMSPQSFITHINHTFFTSAFTEPLFTGTITEDMIPRIVQNAMGLSHTELITRATATLMWYESHPEYNLELAQRAILLIIEANPPSQN